MRDRRSLLYCVAFVLFCELVGGAGSIFTAHEIPTWYAGLHKPAFNPPNWLFGPVWGVLYALIGVAGWRLWREGASPVRNRAMALWWVQLGLNAAWTPVFFGAHAMGVALGIIVLLDVVVVLLLRPAFRVCTVAGALLVPYLGWIVFASVLNEELWRLNR